MMQIVLTKYWLTIHVGLLLFSSWLCLFQPSFSLLVPFFWLALVSMEAAFLLPTVHRGETFADARTRVFHAMARDPFFYFGVAIVLLVVVQWLNSGCKLIYLPEADVWQFTPPAVQGAPFSVEPRAAQMQIAVLIAGVVGCLCLRHAMSQTGRRYLLQSAVTISGLLALFFGWLAWHGVEPYVRWSFGKENCILGSFFGLWLVFGMGVFADALVGGQRGYQVLFVLGVVANLFGVLIFAKALSLILYVGVAVLLFFYWLLFLRTKVPQSLQLKVFSASLGVIICVACACGYLFPGNPVAAKVKGLVPFEQTWNALSETKEIRTAAALKIWQDHPWVGVGVDGFRHFVGASVSDKEWRLLRVDSSCVYNDCLQFLCEYGLLGWGLFFSVVTTLIVPICYRSSVLWKKSGGTDIPDSRIFLLRVSPLVLTGVLATGCCFLESWYSSLFSSPSLLISWVFVLAVLPAFLPTGVKKSAS